MKKNLYLSLITLALILPFALSSHAYFTPTASQPGNNNEAVPIYTNATNQVKNGDLSVNEFDVYNDGIVMQQTFFKGIIRGLSNGTTEDVLIGDATPASIAVRGYTGVHQDISSQTLAHAGSALQNICADSQGKFFLCGGSNNGGNSNAPTVIGADFSVGSLLGNGFYDSTCKATLDNSARPGGETVVITATAGKQSGQSIINTVQYNCTITIPQGSTGGVGSIQTIPQGGEALANSCVSSSSANVPSSLHC